MKKKELRAQFKQRRKSFSKKELDVKSEAIFKNVIENFDLSGKNVSIFLPIERFSEINTWFFIDTIKANFYLPVIIEEGKLVHILYENKKQIEISSWGIPEPTYGDEIDSSKIDIVIVPLLAIDEKGYRVGYGKGFYDQFLSKCNSNCLFIGVSYFDWIDKIDDIHDKDIPLHYCITSEKKIKF